MYTNPNFKTKKALKDALKHNKLVNVYQPNNMFGVTPPTNGTVTLEGPHYPQPHTWYATGTIKDRKLVSVK